MEWAFLTFVAVFFLVELFIYIVRRRQNRNSLLEHLEEIVKLAVHISNELRHPREKANRLCGALVGMVLLFTAAMLFVSAVSLVLIPFDLKEWPSRLLFALAGFTGGLSLTLSFKRLNDALLPPPP